jgi:hypothetical protein
MLKGPHGPFYVMIKRAINREEKLKVHKDERGIAMLVEIILIALVLGVIGFAIYASMQAKKNSTAKASPTPAVTPAVTPPATPEPSAQTIKTTDGAVTVTLANDWKVTSRSDEPIQAQFANGTRILSAALAPSTYAGESRWNVSVYKTGLAPKPWSEGPIGIPSESFTQQSESPINGYPTYYAKIANSSYVDLNYFISSKGYLVYFYERESDKHYTPQGVVDQSSDFSQYTAGFKQMVESIRIQ